MQGFLSTLPYFKSKFLICFTVSSLQLNKSRKQEDDLILKTLTLEDTH